MIQTTWYGQFCTFLGGAMTLVVIAAAFARVFDYVFWCALGMLILCAIGSIISTKIIKK